MHGGRRYPVRHDPPGRGSPSNDDRARWSALAEPLENRAAAVSLDFLHYNFDRSQKTLRVTPAMEAGVTDHVGSLEEIVALA